MKREILFRGKAIKNTFSINEKEEKIKIGDWIYGAVIPFDDGIDLIYERDPNNPKICGCHGIDVDHNTVGQYTGLKDKNGKMIFEGDIFDIGGMLIGEITWHPDGYWCIKDDNEHIGDKSHRPLGEMFDYAIQRNYKYEVIGNIHEKH